MSLGRFDKGYFVWERLGRAHWREFDAARAFVRELHQNRETIGAGIVTQVGSLAKPRGCYVWGAAKRFIKANRAGWKNAKHADQWQMTLLGIDQKVKPTKNDYCTRRSVIFPSARLMRRWSCESSNRSG